MSKVLFWAIRNLSPESDELESCVLVIDELKLFVFFELELLAKV